MTCCIYQCSFSDILVVMFYNCVVDSVAGKFISIVCNCIYALTFFRWNIPLNNLKSRFKHEHATIIIQGSRIISSFEEALLRESSIVYRSKQYSSLTAVMCQWMLMSSQFICFLLSVISNSWSFLKYNNIFLQETSDKLIAAGVT